MMRQSLPTIILALVALLVSACGLGMDTQDRLDRGQEALAEGEYRAAVIDAKNILLDDPNNTAARLLLGRASVEIGDGISAEKELRKAVELGTDFSVVLVGLGRALLLQNKFEDIIAEIDPEMAATDVDRLAAMRTRGEALIGLRNPVAAREIFAEILTSDANDISAQLGVVASYIAERNYQQARATLDFVLTLDDSHITSWLVSGSLSMRAGNSIRAESDYEKAVSLARDHGDKAIEMAALTGLADAVLVQRKSDDARQVLVRMGEIAPNDTRTLLLSAKLASIDADWSKAQEVLQEILRRAPEYRPAQMLLGHVHKESGNLGQAEMYLSAVVAAAPGNSDARRLLAETRLKMDKAEEARTVLDPLLTAPNVDVRSLSMAASASLSLGEYDVAAELLERGVAADPGNTNLRIQLAFAYFRSENPAKAQEILEELPATVDDGDEFRRDSLLVLTKLAQGASAEALEQAKELTVRWPSRSDAHSLVGAIEVTTGDYAAARKSFETASTLAPDDVRSIRYLARLDEIDDDPESATERYELILELEPNDTASMIALAKLSAQGENRVKAREWLERARASDTAAVAPRVLLGSLLLEILEFSEAESVIAEAVKLDPKNPKLLSMLGHAQLNQRDFRGAEFSFGQALQFAPGDASHRLNLARSQAMRGNKASALVTLQDTVEQTMRHIPSAVLLASLKADSGDLDGAASIARQLREAFPDTAVPYALEAELQVRAGNLVAASAAYDKALGIANTQRHAIRSYQIRNKAGLDDRTGPLVNYLEERPFDSDMRMYLAQAYQRFEEGGKANTEYERVLRDEPENFVAANNLAWNYFTSGDSRAEEVARLAYAIKPDDSSVADTLGWVLVKKGSLEEGITMLRHASELGSGRSEIHFHLAAGLVAAGQTAEAKVILQEILATEDEFPSRQEAESLMKSL